MKITYGKNLYNNLEISSVVKTLKKTTQMGVAVSNFENKIAKYFGKKYGLMVNSGSSALILAIESLKFKKGSEIIVPCLNFGTAVSSVLICGHKPVFVDAEIETLQIDISKIKKKITKKTRAIMVPNLIGNVPDWKQINKIANLIYFCYL